jgi:hypothetical protein
MFFDRAFRAVWVDWDLVARRVVGDFRYMSGHLKDDASYTAPLSELLLPARAAVDPGRDGIRALVCALAALTRASEPSTTSSGSQSL